MHSDKNAFSRIYSQNRGSKHNLSLSRFLLAWEFLFIGWFHWLPIHVYHYSCIPPPHVTAFMAPLNVSPTVDTMGYHRTSIPQICHHQVILLRLHGFCRPRPLTLKESIRNVVHWICCQ